MNTDRQANFQLVRLANEIDRLAGQVAALIAFVEATGIPVPDCEFTSMQGRVERMAQKRVGTDPNGAPGVYAVETVERLQKATKKRRPY
jgi:hypothetical protein